MSELVTNFIALASAASCPSRARALVANAHLLNYYDPLGTKQPSEVIHDHCPGVALYRLNP